MRLIFLHQNQPGQFAPLVRHLAATGGHRLTVIGARDDRRLPGPRTIAYRLHRDVAEGIHPYLVRTERAVLYGQAAARVLVALRDQGERPDAIVAHSGWGEALFVKDVFPSVPLLVYSEFYYRARGADVGFEATEPLSLDVAARTRMRNTHLLAELGPDVLPPERVLFTGRLPYETYRRVLQVSAVHVYLTYPFVLSWSMLEAMSCGGLLVASDTAPVTEVIEDGVNGLLVSFHDPAALARRVIEALAARDALAPLRAAARRTVIDRFERTDCLRRQVALLSALAEEGRT
jgi:hypothetical protein